MGYKLLCFALNSPKHKSRRNINDAGKSFVTYFGGRKWSKLICATSWLSLQLDEVLRTISREWTLSSSAWMNGSRLIERQSHWSSNRSRSPESLCRLRRLFQETGIKIAG